VAPGWYLEGLKSLDTHAKQPAEDDRLVSAVALLMMASMVDPSSATSCSLILIVLNFIWIGIGSDSSVEDAGLLGVLVLVLVVLAKLARINRWLEKKALRMLKKAHTFSCPLNTY
jgi:hypothetical protein